LGDRVVFTENVDGEIGDGAVVRGARKRVAEGDQVAAQRFEGPEVHRLGPLVEPGVATLGFEIAAGILLGIKRQDAGDGLVRENVKVVLLGGEERLDEAAARENPAIGNGGKEAALAVVGGDGFGIEGIDVGVPSVDRVESEDARKAVGGIDIPVEWVCVLMRSSMRMLLGLGRDGLRRVS